MWGRRRGRNHHRSTRNSGCSQLRLRCSRKVRSLNSNENRSLHRPKVADAQEDEGVPADSARQLAVDAERLLAQRRERAALAAAAAEARMARNMAMHNTPCEVQGEVLPLSGR